MKKWMLILGLSLFVAAGCTEETTSDELSEIKKTAWDWLSTEEQATVTHRWELARVDRGVHTYCHSNRMDFNYVEGECYQVIFNTRDDALLGPIAVMVDLAEENVIGYQPRL